MIPVDFDYYRPDSLAELSDALRACAGREALLYGGGSEILSMARMGSIAPAAVIDIKQIAETRQLALKDGKLFLGAALTLTEIAEDNRFPLLSTAVKRIADHTNQCRITLGGNVCGTVIYREAVLPLLLAGASVTLWADGQAREVPLSEAFMGRLRRSPDELVVGFSVPESELQRPYVHVKKTRGGKIDYPLVTVAMQRGPEGLRLAISGACGFPYLEPKPVLNDSSLPSSERAKAVAFNLPGATLDDSIAHADYRQFLLQETVRAGIDRLCGNS
ncbi:MAG: FAD binding domain-containing protein [Clostridia bacterium]|nr:FAD binding domain-containing protein [Clostridia bacterium]